MKISHRMGVATVEVGRVTGSLCAPSSDELSAEEPLEIRLSKHDGDSPPTSIAVTMRTPGDDVDLAAGFLFTEGIIAGAGDIEGIARAGLNAAEARLRPSVAPDTAKLDRRSFVSSSCGACSKLSIAAVRGASRHPITPGVPCLSPEALHGLPRSLRASQSAFTRTGGIHASGLFDRDGRHNALDKLIGSELLAGRIPLFARNRPGQRTGELRARAEGGNRGRRCAWGRRGPVQPGSRPDSRVRDDAARFRSRRALQRLL